MKVGALKNKLRSLGIDDDMIRELGNDDEGPTAAAFKPHFSYGLYSCGPYIYGSILWQHISYGRSQGGSDQAAY